MEASQIAVIESPRKRDVITAPPAASTPMELLRLVVAQGGDIEKMKQLMELSERLEANQARKAFVAAMAQFKKSPPEIIKNKHVKFQTQKGTTEYDHATLDAVCDAVIKGLSDVGITHDWETEQPSGKIRVTCVLTHVDGHSKRTSLESAPDESGGKNSIQAIASAVSYLERYTLLAATGLAVKGMDNDGRTNETRETLSAEQIANIEALISEVGADKRRFFNYCKVSSLEQILACNYSTVVKMLEAKRAR